MAVISRLNPILRGWVAYYRTVVSSQVFNDIDSNLCWAMLKWARRQHEAKTDRWIVDRYFGRFHQGRQAKWIFGDRATGAYPGTPVLDTHPPAPHGRRRRVPGRPDADLLLAATPTTPRTTEHNSTDSPNPTTPDGTCLSRTRRKSHVSHVRF